MPKFEWRGQTAAGQQISGSIIAEDKREAMARLRDVNGVTIHTLKQRGDADDSVPDVSSRVDRAAGPANRGTGVRQLPRPRPFRGLLIAVGFVAAAGVVNALAPIITFRCERAGGGAATCSVTRRILGYPIDRQALAGVERAEVESRRTDTRANARPAESTITRLVFRSAGGSIRPADWDYPTTGTRTRRSRTPELLADDFNAFLSDPSQTTLSRWHVQTVPMILVGLLLLFAVGTLWLTWFALKLGREVRTQTQG